MELIIKKKDKQQFVKESEFPKYTTQIMNLFNSGAGSCTSPKIVGPLKEIFKDFQESNEEHNLENWKRFYEKNYKDRYQDAFEKIVIAKNKYIEALKQIDDQMLRDYQQDLIIKKTFFGLSEEYFIFKLFIW